MKFLFTFCIAFAIVSTNVFGQITESPIKVGDPSPVFSLPDLQNNYVFLRDYSGEKLRKPWKNKTKYVIVMSFFATWCAPCKKEIPYLTKLKNYFTGKPVKFYLVDVGEEKQKVKAFVVKNKIELPILFDQYQVVSDKYGANSLPRLVVIDKNGKIKKYEKGFDNPETFIAEMKDLISELLEG